MKTKKAKNVLPSLSKAEEILKLIIKTGPTSKFHNRKPKESLDYDEGLQDGAYRVATFLLSRIKDTKEESSE